MTLVEDPALAEARLYWAGLRDECIAAEEEVKQAVERRNELQVLLSQADEGYDRTRLEIGLLATLDINVFRVPERELWWSKIAQDKLKACSKSLAQYEQLAWRHNSWDSQVSKDVPRSLTALGVSVQDVETEETLSRMLRAWISRSKEEGMQTGYVQGMNLRCAVACVALRSPEEAFGLASFVIEDLGVPGTFSAWPPLEGVMAAKALLVEEVEERMPRMAAELGEHLEKETNRTPE
eukprot:Hpha_TRINITY_DN15229_c0_g4::TRINITY_DN15229_c0_g4_i2::g.65187::m.65187